MASFSPRNLHKRERFISSKCPEDESHIEISSLVMRGELKERKNDILGSCMRYLSMKGGFPYVTIYFRLIDKYSFTGLKITLVTPGNNVQEILQCVGQLSKNYNQTILLGYPPFIKGVIDAGISSKIPWSELNLGMVFAGEVFSEEWRLLVILSLNLYPCQLMNIIDSSLKLKVAKRAGISNPLTRMVSMYGTADAGVLAHETPLSARIRQWVASKPDIARKLFGRDRLPSLLQYDPSRYCITSANVIKMPILIIQK